MAKNKEKELEEIEEVEETEELEGLESEVTKEEYDENKLAILLALALLLSELTQDDISGIEKFSDLPENVQKDAVTEYARQNLDDLAKTKDLTNIDIQHKMAEIGREVEDRKSEKNKGSEEKTAIYYEILNPGDDRTCEDCQEWIGKVVSDEDPDYPNVGDFFDGGGLHVGCRCSLHKIEKPAKTVNTENTVNSEPTMNELEKFAEMTEILKDKIVYRGFVDDRYADDDVEYDFGETLVMIAPMGEWTGGTTDGKIVKQVIDDLALENLVGQNEEILVDKDHGSMKSPMERDTQAYGWCSNLIAVKEAGDFSGLYGTIKWSEEGKRLIIDRSYRFISPAFELDKNGRPTRLISIGLTNRPNFKMAPIINSEPEDEEKTIVKTEDIMSKSEIVSLIQTTVAEALKANGEKTEEKVEKVEEKTEEVVETVETVENSECKTEEKTEKVEKVENTEKAEKEEKVEKVEEVIKEEVLNTIPENPAENISVEEKPWKHLHGDELRRWMSLNLK